MPTARRIATPMNSAKMVTRPLVVVVPDSKAGSTTLSVDQPSTQASATVRAPNRTLPSVERVKTQGSRRMATPSTRNPSIRVEVFGARLTGSSVSRQAASGRSTQRVQP